MNAFSNIVEIYRVLANKTVHDNTLEGNLQVRDEEMRSFLLSAMEEPTSTDCGLCILAEPEEVKVSATVHIRLFPPRRIPIFRDLSAYLGNGSRFMEPIGDFYIVDEDWSSEDLKQSQPAKAANLNALHQVMKQLSESATVVDKEKRRLLFADSAGLVSLPIDISPEDLRAVTPQRADAFVHFCADMLHRQHRLEVMANVVILQTRGVTANDRLHYVLRNLESILSDAKSQHAVFLSAFSYEKVRDEIESLKVEYTTKIHKVISEIQGQLLGIPAATVVVAIQLKKADAIDSIFITNMAVLLGALIFGVFMILLLINQAHTLEVIKPEVGRQKRQLRTELLDVADRFDDVFTLLQNRIRYQNGILWSVVAGLLLSGMAFWVLSSIANRSIF